MKLNKRFAGALVGAALLVGTIGSGAVFAQQAKPTATPPAVQQETDRDDQAHEPAYTGSIAVPQEQQEGKSEADEATALQGMAKISADQAKAAAVSANPGTTASKADLEDENGVLVYAVTLSNGVEVKVDAGNAQVLHTEQADQNDEKDDGAAKDEDAGQPNEAPETAGASSAVGE